MNPKLGLAILISISLSGTAGASTWPVRGATPVALLQKKRSTIKLYPNPCTTGAVQVVSNSSGELHFYMFDVAGTLLHQAVLKDKAKHTIKNLKKGVYTYDAFYNDEGVDHGQLVVK